jgi:hypothetical protein
VINFLSGLGCLMNDASGFKHLGFKDFLEFPVFSSGSEGLYLLQAMDAKADH